jgi:hypothetical protein
MEEMIIGPINRLGHVIDTCRLSVDTPADFLNPLCKKLSTMWGPHCESFTVLEAKTLAGQLVHVSFAAPWLKHIMPHIYQLLASVLRLNCSHLISLSSSIWFALKQIKWAPSLPTTLAARLSSFFQADSTCVLHHASMQHYIN